MSHPTPEPERPGFDQPPWAREPSDPSNHQRGYPVGPYQPDHGYPPGPGQPYGVAHQPQYPIDPRQQASYGGGYQAAQKSRLAAGLLAIFLGGFGIHNFYLGRIGIGVLQLLLTVLSLGFLAPLVWIWVIVEAILIFTRSPSFATDARGIPLGD